ncbi:hypothetical protein ACFL5U_02000 [Candidatus Margulisiibacteriota bacterium]
MAIVIPLWVAVTGAGAAATAATAWITGDNTNHDIKNQELSWDGPGSEDVVFNTTPDGIETRENPFTGEKEYVGKIGIEDYRSKAVYVNVKTGKTDLEIDGKKVITNPRQWELRDNQVRQDYIEPPNIIDKIDALIHRRPYGGNVDVPAV